MANNNDKFISRENAKTLWGYMIDLLTGKQNKLTFDDTPTQSSDNPVKSGGIFTALAGKGTYSKPQNGIPKTDLESAVQTSLGKADSALQSETDPTVPSWAKQSSKPSYTSDEISDTNQTHKFATAAQLQQISTNQTNVLSVMINNSSVISSGDLNDISENKFAVYSDNVSNRPTSDSDYYYVKTSKYDNTSILQEAYSLSSGRMYSRVKYGGTWRSWMNSFELLGNRIRSDSPDVMAKFDGAVNVYVNKQQHRVIVEWNLTTKEVITNYSAGVLKLHDDELYLKPVADVYVYFTADDNSFLIRLGKNHDNAYGAFRMLNGTIPINTEINMYMEWSYI